MTTEEVNRELMRGLADMFPTAKSTGNYKLLEPIATELSDINVDIDDIDAASTVKHAETIDQLELLGVLFNTPRLEGESLEHYRSRLLIRASVYTSEGTVVDLIDTAATFLDVSPENMSYDEPSGSEYGTVSLGMPSAALDQSALTAQEAADELSRVIPASYRLDALVSGTFTYITPTDYNSGTHDPALGYDGLDGSGNPKDNGGTYAGLIQ